MSPWSAQDIASNDDLLSEILRRLPIRPLFRFKSVSKHWLSLITNPVLSLYQNPDPNTISGFFFPATDFTLKLWDDERYPPLLEFIKLEHDSTPDDEDLTVNTVTLIPNLSRITILNSSHGLLLCLGYNEIKQKGGYHILNPTTKQFKILPDPNLDGLEGLSLAFDPSKSPHYTIVSVRGTNRLLSSSNRSYSYQTFYQIEIYSSQTGVWYDSGERFTVNAHQMRFDEGVYWNGAIHWSSEYGDWIYFNIEREQLGKIPDLPLYFDVSMFRFCESRGHLHVVKAYEDSTCFDVYEMERDYSQWFVKYKVDLSTMYDLSEDLQNEDYTVLSIVRGDIEEESFALLHFPGKIVSYNFIDQTFKCVWSSGDQAFNMTWNGQPMEDPLLYCGAHQYIKSYHCV